MEKSASGSPLSATAGLASSGGAVVGALAGAAYGLDAIPAVWRAALHGEWPLRSGVRWDAGRLATLADQSANTGGARRTRPRLPARLRQNRAQLREKGSQ